MLLQYRGLGGRISWDEGPLGARASRPHKSWHSLGHLHDLDQPGTAPWLSFGVADVAPSHRVAACSIARKLSAGQAANAAGCLQRRWPSLRGRPGTGVGACLSRNKVRAGRPRSRGITLLLRESRGSRAEGRRLMRWGGGARPGNRFFSQLTSMHRMHRINRTGSWCRRSSLGR